MGSQGGEDDRQHLPSRKPGRRGSLYSLTLREVQTHLGLDSFQSMNLDELLRTVLPADDLRPLETASSRKTVGEVWRDIGDGRPALGEVTLEDFLAKATGVVVADGHGNAAAEPRDYSPGIPWLPQYHQQPQHAMAQSLASVADPPYPETPGRKRVAPGDGTERTVERKQKRMIKNRESAARSRARKQAYTHELENKISRLEEENERLKKQKELDMLLNSAPPPEPKRRLRRTTSAAF